MLAVLIFSSYLEQTGNMRDAGQIFVKRMLFTDKKNKHLSVSIHFWLVKFADSLSLVGLYSIYVSETQFKSNKDHNLNAVLTISYVETLSRNLRADWRSSCLQEDGTPFLVGLFSWQLVHFTPFATVSGISESKSFGISSWKNK